MKPNFTYSLTLFLILLLSFPVYTLAQRDNLNDRVPKKSPPDERLKRPGNEEKEESDRNKGRETVPIYKERNPQPPANEIIVERPVVEVFPVIEVVPMGRCGGDVRRSEINYKKPNYKTEGIKKFNDEDYWGALDDFNIAIDETPEDYELYFHRGKVEIKIKLFEEAKEDLDIFIEYNFYEPEAYFQRGLVKFFLNKKEAALEDFRIASDMGHKFAGLIIKRFYN